MLPVFSDRTRSLLLQSWPLVHQNKNLLIDRLGARLRAAQPDETESSELVAMMLVELVIAQTRNLLLADALCDEEQIGPEHEALGISERHYSRFGDDLAPVLEGLPGAKIQPAAAAAWRDAFRASIRGVRAARRQAARPASTI